MKYTCAPWQYDTKEGSEEACLPAGTMLPSGPAHPLSYDAKLPLKHTLPN